MHQYYVEIVNEDGELVAGSTADSETEATTFIKNQLKTNVAYNSDEALLYNVYIGADGQQYWGDLEWRMKL